MKLLEKDKEYFCGWYFKCESGGRTVAVIPARHSTADGEFCSLQIVTEEGAFYLTFSGSDFVKGKKALSIKVGNNIFSAKGLRLNLHTNEVEASGELRFGSLQPLAYDIMGPFCLAPGMECRHSVFSLRHRVDGRLLINGREYLFRSGTGYVEGDRGRSFPERYVWTQCCFPEGSLMLSVADIPLGAFRFTGVICVILWRGRQYRLATYLGAGAAAIGKGSVTIRQGRMRLTARLIQKKALPLKAPSRGDMTRIIRESAACRASYRFVRGGETVFEFETDRASFEYEYPG